MIQKRKIVRLEYTLGDKQLLRNFTANCKLSALVTSFEILYIASLEVILQLLKEHI